MKQSLTLALALTSSFLFAPASASAAPSPAGADKSLTAEKPVRHFTVTLNPLSLLRKTFGVNIELLPARHHAIEISPYLDLAQRDVSPAAPAVGEKRSLSKLSPGGEIGYRFYSGDSGASGFFIGPSAVLMPFAYVKETADGAGDIGAVYRVGAAIDLGGQLVTSSGFTFGGGIGGMYIPYKEPSDARKDVITITSPILPRLLLSAGWSF